MLLSIGTTVCAVMLVNSLFLYVLRGNRHPTNLITLVFVLTALVPIAAIIQKFDTDHYMRALFNPSHVVMVMAIFPLIYFYLFELMLPGCLKLKHWLAAYAPPVVFMLILAVVNRTYGSLPSFASYDQIWPFLDKPAMWVRISGIFMMIAEQVVFTMVTLRMHNDHKRRMVDEFSNFEGCNLRWVRWIAFTMIIQGVCALACMTVEGYAVKLVMAVTVVTIPTMINIFVVRQKDLYTTPEKDPDTADNRIDNGTPEEEPRHLRLGEELLLLFEKDEIFRDPDLSGDKVSRMLNTNRTYLWALINREWGTNFYTLVNGYRLQKAEAMMRDAMFMNMSLGSIAEMCGFRSLSSFSTYFRQEYGVTPSEFRKKYH